MRSLAHGADFAKVQEWMGHATISTIRMYDKRRSRPEGSPTFKVSIERAAILATAPQAWHCIGRLSWTCSAMR
jgi:hypothetical protein